jgi:hypothetical protein
MTDLGSLPRGNPAFLEAPSCQGAGGWQVGASDAEVSASVGNQNTASCSGAAKLRATAASSMGAHAGGGVPVAWALMPVAVSFV